MPIFSLMKGGFGITIIPSPRQISNEFRQVALDLRSFKEPLTRFIKEIAAPSLRTNFLVGGRPAWVPLSEATLAWRAYKGSGEGGPLVFSGTLMEVAGQQNIWKINGPAGEAYIAGLPSRAFYGTPQNFGFKSSSQAFGGPSIPARPWAVLQPEDVDGMAQVFGDWLEERISQRMGGI